MNYKAKIAVFGGRTVGKELYAETVEIGRLMAEENWLVFCGGGSGVMEAVARGWVEYPAFPPLVLPLFAYVVIAIPPEGMLSIGPDHPGIGESLRLIGCVDAVSYVEDHLEHGMSLVNGGHLPSEKLSLYGEVHVLYALD